MNILWPVQNLEKGNNQFLGIMTISSLLEKYGHHSEVVEAEYKAVSRKLDTGNFAMVAFSTMSLYCYSYLKLNRKLKETYPVFSVFGGPHPTFFPEMIQQDGVDGICIGEGEYPMLDLVNNLSSGKAITDIPNWWVKSNGHIHKNGLRPLIADLNELPLPDHDIFRRAVPWDIWRAVIMTGRGCPYGCTYCYNNAYKKLYAGCGKIVRRRSVDNVISELETLRQHACYRYIQISDDLFTISSEWIKEFCEKYREKIDLPFSCFARVNHITQEMVDNLRQAGCGRIIIGVETGDERVRLDVFKRKMTNDEIVATSRMIKKAGIKLMTTNILGIPGASMESDYQTLELNIKLKPDFAAVNLLQPYPRTEIYEYARSLDLLSGEMGEGEIKQVMLSSLIKFPNETERRKVENFEKFFAIAVAFPILLPLIKLLILLPQNRVYNYLFSFWTEYSFCFRIIPVRVGLVSMRKKMPFRGIVRRLFQ